jgi:Outer membrane protein beta-barrel domain
MIKSSVLILFILLSISCFGQSDNWYFSFSMGGSWPSNTFGQTNLNDNSSAYAQKGFSLLLDATYPLNDRWGFKGLVLINTNSIDNNSMEKMLINRLPAAISNPVSDKFSFATNPWMWNAFVGGPVYTINLGRLYWDLQILAGLNLTYLPQQKLLYNPFKDDPTNSQRWYYTDSNTTSTNLSWGVLAGTAFRFPLSERLNLKLGVDYYLSSARVKYQQSRTSQQAESVKVDILGSGSNLIPIKMITGTIGFVYYLN